MELSHIDPYRNKFTQTRSLLLKFFIPFLIISSSYSSDISNPPELKELNVNLNNIRQTIYEDAENKNTIGWSIDDNKPSGARIYSLYDSLKKSQVIVLDGSGRRNSYKLGNHKNKQGAWNHRNQTHIAWDMKFDNTDISFYISLDTRKGQRYLQYSPHDDKDGFREDLHNYIQYAIGDQYADNQWHTVVRDLQADLRKYEPDNAIITINAFRVRGSGRLDNIKIGSFRGSTSPLSTILPIERLTAFYGDIRHQRIVGIDVESFTFSSNTLTFGEKPYTVGRADGRNGVLNKLYGITRNSPWLEIIDLETPEEIAGTIPLQHTPRSCAYNEVLGLQLVSGVNKPMASLIDPITDKVVATVGRNVLVKPTDFGGSNATGHPAWLNTNTFAILDREARKIDLYTVKKLHGQWDVSFLSSLDTSTSVHHFIANGTDGMDSSITFDSEDTDTFYAVEEGSIKNNISPRILELKLSNNQLIINRSVAFDANTETGAHHATFHPDGEHIYVGSSAGEVIVIDKQSMRIISRIPAGDGAGHILFVPQRNIAIVTNHHAKYITVVNTKTHKKIKDIEVSGDSRNDIIMQSHTSFTDNDGNFFYAFASNNGIFYELDLSTLEISRSIDTGGTPVQGCFTYLE